MERAKQSVRLAMRPKARTGTRYLSLIKRDRYLYFLILPVIVYFIIFKYIPMFGALIAFQDYNLSLGVFGSRWVGLKHFAALFGSKDFYNVIRNTLLLNFYLILFSFPVPVVLAILLNEVRCMGYRKVVQSILYVPHFMSWVVLGGIVISVLSPSSGIVNSIIKSFGGEPIYFMANTGWWIVMFVVSDIWQTAGWGTIIYLAAITGIDQEMYEAARIDGASKWQQMVHITLPSIAGTVSIMLILRIGKMMDMNFEQVYALQNDAVRAVSEVISTFEYRYGLEGMQYSYTTALGLFKGTVGLILVTFANKFANAIGDNGLW